MKLPSIDRLFELQRFLYDFRNIERAVHFPNKSPENDVEHSYSLAMTGWYIASYFPELNKDKIIQFAMVHDLVEVHAGDTYIYADAATLASKQAREDAALIQIKADWADFPELIESIETYEKLDTPESAFVYALDKIMPVLLVYIAEGYTWKQENITVAMLHEKKRDKVTISPQIDMYYQKLHELLKQSPHLLQLK